MLYFFFFFLTFSNSLFPMVHFLIKNYILDWSLGGCASVNCSLSAISLRSFSTRRPTLRIPPRSKTAKSTVIRLGYYYTLIPPLLRPSCSLLVALCRASRSKSSRALDPRVPGVDFDLGIYSYIIGEDLALDWIDLEQYSPISRNSSSPPITPAVAWGASTN